MLAFFQSKKFLTLALILSLGVNIFLVGQMIGRQTRQQMMMGRLTEQQIERLVDAAPAAKQEKLRVTLAANMKNISADLDAIHVERQNLANLMVAENFNEDELQRQFALLRVRMNYLQKHLQLLTMNMLRDLSPDERMQAVRMMQPKHLWQPRVTGTANDGDDDDDNKIIEIKPDGKKL